MTWSTPLYKLYWFVQPQRVLFLSRFGLKMVKILTFWSESLKTGVDFTETGVDLRDQV